ncbi:MAG: GWxTD domain-containing protein, partial [Bacteroidetes bacterium]|nr:GWxTD domain-containing protein [Bacteroidota bacterium]
KTTFTMAVLLLVAPSLFAQQQFPLNLRYDIARYYGDERNIYIELYYSFDVSALKYGAESGGIMGEAVVTSVIKRSANDSIVARQGWRIPFNVTDSTMLQQSRMYSDIFAFLLTPDIYRVYITASDFHNPAVKDSVSFLVDIKPMLGDAVALSDVQLSTSIIPMERDSTNRFYKNSFEVKPNPSRLYGAHQPVLFYYLEAYNLKLKTSEYYYTKAVITNAVGKEVISHEKPKRRMNASSVEVGKVNVNALRTGTYTFTYSIIDSTDGSIVSSSERFNVFNPSLPMDTLVNPNAMNVDATEYATMSEQEVDKEFDHAKYISTRNELEQYKKLSGVEAKRKALFEFWTKRDEDMQTPQNEKKIEYFKRIADANAQYKTGFREGWKSDRGRVYIIYGQPDEVERHANEIDVKPYEVWYYNAIQGGVQFIFGDRTGFSDYILLHSTHRNELRDENWRKQIQAN